VTLKRFQRRKQRRYELTFAFEYRVTTFYSTGYIRIEKQEQGDVVQVRDFVLLYISRKGEKEQGHSMQVIISG
jgi:hypothetical protein